MTIWDRIYLFMESMKEFLLWPFKFLHDDVNFLAITSISASLYMGTDGLSHGRNFQVVAGLGNAVMSCISWWMLKRKPKKRSED